MQYQHGKVVNFTHNDLDGIGSAVIVRSVFPESEIYYCNHIDIDDKIEAVSFPDVVIITDIYPHRASTVAYLNDLVEQGTSVYLFDHHPLGVECFRNNPHFEGESHIGDCGARLVQQFFCDDEFKTLADHIHDFDANTVRDPNSLGFKLNLIYTEVGVERMFDLIRNQKHFEWRRDYDFILEKVYRQMNSALEKAVTMQDKCYIVSGKKIAITNDKELKRFSNEICEKENDIDLYIFAMENEVSFRKGKKNTIPCDAIATLLGGGGHPFAAGSPVPESVKGKPLSETASYLVNIITNFLDKA